MTSARLTVPATATRLLETVIIVNLVLGEKYATRHVGKVVEISVIIFLAVVLAEIDTMAPNVTKCALKDVSQMCAIKLMVDVFLVKKDYLEYFATIDVQRVVRTMLAMQRLDIVTPVTKVYTGHIVIIFVQLAVEITFVFRHLDIVISVRKASMEEFAIKHVQNI